VGGDGGVVRRLTPLFQTFSKAVIHVGGAGAGQYGKLFNNVLMMMNHKNALDVLRLADGLDLPIQAIRQVLLSGSASSFALAAIGPSVTSGNVSHLIPLELIDVGLFGGAVTALGDAARPVIDRATAGASELDQLTALILR
jgi:3-hydroxyisobutyrate dehydrogenase-like beta-hydroxyacid dehydrogenase